VANNSGTSAYLTRRVVQGMPYLGVGLGAQSFTDTSISYNSGAVGKNLSPYFKKIDQEKLPIQDLYDLPRAHMMAKMIAVSFYFGEVNLSYFKEKFNMTFEQAYAPAIQYALQRGLMEYTDSDNGLELIEQANSTFGAHNRRCFSLTEKGAEHFNGTIALFFAPSVQGHIMKLEDSIAHSFSTHQELEEEMSPHTIR